MTATQPGPVPHFSPASSQQAVPAYEALARHYDCYSAGNDYVQWADLLLRLAREHGWEGSTALDVGAGTGAIADVLADRGLTVTAVDASPSMVAQAIATRTAGARFMVGDAVTLELGQDFDLVVCTDDVLNYLLQPADVSAARSALYRHTVPGGFLIFDVNTLLVYRTSFADCRVAAHDDCVLVRHGHGYPQFAPGDTCMVDLTIVETSTAGRTLERVRRTSHAQRHHPIGELVAAVESSGYRVCACLSPDHAAGTLVEFTDELRSNKVIVVARRPLQRLPG